MLKIYFCKYCHLDEEKANNNNCFQFSIFLYETKKGKVIKNIIRDLLQNMYANDKYGMIKNILLSITCSLLICY